VAYVDTIQCLLLAFGIAAIGVITLNAVGGWSALQDGIAKLTSPDVNPILGTRIDTKITPDGYSHYIAIPGVIQFVKAGASAVGGAWTGVMCLTYMFALMGIQSAPAFSMWSFSNKNPRPFAPQQVWASSAGIGFILIILTVVLTAVSIVREKELGTIEQINVSPVTDTELLIGKIIPYTVISFLVSVIILFAGYLLFGIQLKGSIVLLFFTILLYLVASLNIGILVSTIADSQQVAFQLGMLFSMLPSMLLSGFIFPIESMPKVLQLITNISPTKFFLIALRAILIKGAGIEAFWDQLVYLAIYALVFFLLATLRMRLKETK
jgi:ABC-type multidrug transport system permease subunit